MVIGAGIAGMQAALDLANAGIEVVLVEKNPSIGGHMAQLSETFPTLDCSQCILTPKMNEVGHHPNIELMTYSEVVEVEGHVGKFNVKVKKRPRYVDMEKCTACNKCSEVCPVIVHSEFNEGLGSRKAIYVPFPQAVPQTYVLDDVACLGLFPLACSKCMEACDPGAINYDEKPEYLDFQVGAIVVATGFDLLPEESIKEYGYGNIPDVVTSLEFERLLSASGPTGGEVRRPSDRKIPKEIVFVQCAGSRDPEHGKPYCSKVCCMYTAKHAMLYKHRVPDGQPYIFYIDIRSGGKGYEEFVQRTIDDEGVVYLRGKVSKIFQEGDKVIVWGADTLSGKEIEIEADMVVLAMAIVPNESAVELAKMLKIGTDEHGFMREAHIKLRPLETTTAGIFLAGIAQTPKDIPDTVSQASGAASKVLALLSGDTIELEPLKSEVVDENCDGCAYCIEPCPYDALTLIEFMRNGQVKKTVEANEVLCQGCGVCQATCPKKGIIVRNFKLDQLTAMVDSILEAA
jgi:heterodisulfide reductase subunit A